MGAAELYTDDNKSKYSSHPQDIFKSAKKAMENFTPRRHPRRHQVLRLNFSAKSLIQRKYLMSNLTFVRRKYI